MSRLQNDFERNKCIRLRKFIEEQFLLFLLNEIRTCHFEPSSYGVGKELTANGSSAYTALTFLVNDSRLFDAIRGLTGCGRIGSFAGRLSRMLPNENQAFDWHDDAFDHRMLGFSINLSEGKFVGGRFQMRTVIEKKVLVDIRNSGLGDALLFQITPDLEHRVSPTRGVSPRTTFSGWFRLQPDYEELLRLRTEKGKR